MTGQVRVAKLNIRTRKDHKMQMVNKFMMLATNVGDMPNAKAFYVEKLGLKVATEYRQNDDNWWVTLEFVDGGATLTLARASASPEAVKAGTLALYFETSDVDAAQKELTGKGVKAGAVRDDLFGPGSGVKFLNFEDPDGNVVHVVQAHPTRAPF
jgi:catechol 2,3-dioxygenase-like lactoylglutathione lyase family enzyme